MEFNLGFLQEGNGSGGDHKGNSSGEAGERSPGTRHSVGSRASESVAMWLPVCERAKLACV